MGKAEEGSKGIDMAADEPPQAQEIGEKLIDWKGFLESVPPESTVTVLTELTLPASGIHHYYTEKIPIQLYCDYADCKSIMWFDHTSGTASARLNTWTSELFYYQCRNCKKGWKL